MVSRPGARADDMLLVMNANGSVLEDLSRDECLRLMGSVPIGRIVYTRQALPAVEVVSFTLDDGDIVIPADADGKLAAATRGAVVAFEADSVDVAGHAGWSVTVVGHAQAVTDGEPGHCIRISPAIVTGRRLGASAARGSGGRRLSS